ncbi:hypothetical protein FM106_22385 [Brachybacterium faecium]|nr:hypothetical protein FM106_22385 [Brachybacterium faecium]
MVINNSPLINTSIHILIRHSSIVCTPILHCLTKNVQL